MAVSKKKTTPKKAASSRSKSASSTKKAAGSKTASTGKKRATSVFEADVYAMDVFTGDDSDSGSTSASAPKASSSKTTKAVQKPTSARKTASTKKAATVKKTGSPKKTTIKTSSSKGEDMIGVAEDITDMMPKGKKRTFTDSERETILGGGVPASQTKAALVELLDMRDPTKMGTADTKRLVGRGFTIEQVKAFESGKIPAGVQSAALSALIGGPKEPTTRLNSTETRAMLEGTDPNAAKKVFADVIENPMNHEPRELVDVSKDFVVIKDKFPKSHLHWLVLPRDRTMNEKYPFDPLGCFNQEKKFLEEVKKEMERVKELARVHLIRERMDCQTHWKMAVANPDWAQCFRVGVHAGPSLEHLHIHIFSVDRDSPFIKKASHYNSFDTEFCVGLDEFPLKKNDVRMDKHKRHGLLERDPMKCWRCKREFAIADLKKFKQHLVEESEEWMKGLGLD